MVRTRRACHFIHKHRGTTRNKLAFCGDKLHVTLCFVAIGAVQVSNSSCACCCEKEPSSKKTVAAVALPHHIGTVHQNAVPERKAANPRREPCQRKVQRPLGSHCCYLVVHNNSSSSVAQRKMVIASGSTEGSSKRRSPRKNNNSRSPDMWVLSDGGARTPSHATVCVLQLQHSNTL